jgi:hypothetical protein
MMAAASIAAGSKSLVSMAVAFRIHKLGNFDFTKVSTATQFKGVVHA